jgi:trigger factor
MQVTETVADGLKRELKVVVAAGELGQRFADRIDEVKDRIHIRGFRPGKVPVAHIKKVFGRSLMAEVMQSAVEETSRQALSDRKERPAYQPKIVLPEDKDELERVIDGKADLAYGLEFEVLPEIRLVDLASLNLERIVADVGQDSIDRAIGDLLDRNTSFEAEAGRAGADGDRLTIDFAGRIDGVEFEGGKGEDVILVLGQGRFLPGFEDGLGGAVAGDKRTVNATFPAEYSVAALAGKAAVFDVTVKEVARPKKPELNDEFARTLGADSVDKLRALVAAQLEREFDALSRARLKRALLDALEKAHDFALPPSLVDGELESIWRQAEETRKQAGKTLADEGKSEEEAKAEYRRIAERRVKLGLVIGEIGNQSKIEVSQDEMRRALIEQARRFPGKEKHVYEFYEKTPGAVAELRAPIFEDKVVDHIIEMVKPAERKVSREELFKLDEPEAREGR